MENLSRGARQLGRERYLALADRVILSRGTTFFHMNSLARLHESTRLKFCPICFLFYYYVSCIGFTFWTMEGAAATTRNSM